MRKLSSYSHMETNGVWDLLKNEAYIKLANNRIFNEIGLFQ
jgi:hypothetical protein